MFDLNRFEKYKKVGSGAARKLPIEYLVAVDKTQIRVTKAAADFIGDRQKVSVFIDSESDKVAIRFGDKGDFSVSRRHGVPTIFGGSALAYTVGEFVGQKPFVKIVDDSTLLLSKSDRT